MNTEAEVKDLEQQFIFLRGECSKVSDELTAKHAEKEQIDLAIAKLHSDLDAREKALDQREAKLVKDTADFEALCKNTEGRLLFLNGEIRDKSQQEKSLLKELARLNAWIQTAEESGKALDKKNELLASKIEERTKIVADLETLSYAKLQLENEVSRFKGQLSEIQDELDQSLANAKKATLAEENLLAEAKLKKEMEEIAYTETRQKRVRIDNDIAIYIKRAQVVYANAFPELEMKM